jgi:hypothetical protein
MREERKLEFGKAKSIPINIQCFISVQHQFLPFHAESMKSFSRTGSCKTLQKLYDGASLVLWIS